MKLQGTYDPVTLTDPATLSQLQARRRAILGSFLIVVGSGWLCLRLWGVIGDVPMPIDWLLSHIGQVDGLALPMPQIAYGMLAAHTIDPTR